MAVSLLLFVNLKLLLIYFTMQSKVLLYDPARAILIKFSPTNVNLTLLITFTCDLSWQKRKLSAPLDKLGINFSFSFPSFSYSTIHVSDICNISERGMIYRAEK